ncbi:MAG: hypothetical protein A2X47_03960 [Lentisphaerae bacterium GWF2_38_69]|nr:MAG: hypothetical protein A2X47_03960 [Lentisphaerae bacterium GWF2_38_69]
MSKITVTQLKKYLEARSKEELLKEITELFGKSENVQDYVNRTYKYYYIRKAISDRGSTIDFGGCGKEKEKVSSCDGHGDRQNPYMYGSD